jgi:hypothetical protein
MARGITEIKRHINKPTERYECQLLADGPGRAVLRYVSDRAFASERLGVTFPPGCVTVAYYWEDRPYVFWGIFSPGAELLGYLVHICREVEIGADAVSYLDMLLDIWFYPDGRHIIMDEDEVEECLESGKLDREDAAYIAESRQIALCGFDSDARELVELAEKLDISSHPK